MIKTHVNKIELFHSGGNGGIIFKILMEDEEYIVKCDQYEQSINEYVAHSLISSLGFCTPEVVLVRIDKTILSDINLEDIPIDTFGAVKLIPNTKRILDRNVYLSQNKKQVKSYIELFMLDRLLGDVDKTIEIFENVNGKMFLLDLGEALIGCHNLYLYFENISAPELLSEHMISSDYISVDNLLFKIWLAKKSCCDSMKKYNYYDEELLKMSILAIINRLALLDMRKMRKLFDELKNAYGKTIEEEYKQYIRHLRSSCRLVLEHQMLKYI